MATSTTNFNLNLPEENDFYDVNLENENMIKIDDVLQKHKESLNDHENQLDLIENMPEVTTAISDETLFVGAFKDKNSTGTLYKRTFSTMWGYIQGKIANVLGLTKTGYNGNSATSTKATNDSNGNNIVNTYATKTDVNSKINNPLPWNHNYLSSGYSDDLQYRKIAEGSISYNENNWSFYSELEMVHHNSGGVFESGNLVIGLRGTNGSIGLKKVSFNSINGSYTNLGKTQLNYKIDTENKKIHLEILAYCPLNYTTVLFRNNLTRINDMLTNSSKFWTFPESKTYIQSSETMQSGATDEYTNIPLTVLDNEVIPISKGGTGAKTSKVAQYNLLKDMEEVTTDLGDDAYITCNYIESSNTKGVIYKRKTSTLWNYIKDKISSVLGLTASNYKGTSAKATNDKDGNDITTTYAKATMATQTENGLMSSSDKSKLDKFARKIKNYDNETTGTNVNFEFKDSNINKLLKMGIPQDNTQSYVSNKTSYFLKVYSSLINAEKNSIQSTGITSFILPPNIKANVAYNVSGTKQYIVLYAEYL